MAWMLRGGRAEEGATGGHVELLMSGGCVVGCL